MSPKKSFEKMHALRLNPLLSAAQNCYAKDRLWKFAVKEIYWQCMLIFFEITYLGGVKIPS